MPNERDIERWRQNNNLYGEAEFKRLQQELKEARARIARLEDENRRLKWEVPRFNPYGK